MPLQGLSSDRVVAGAFVPRRHDVPIIRNLYAVILAAGRGSRLEGETRDVPKCLVELGRCSLLEYQLRCLSEMGIDAAGALPSLVIALRDESGEVRAAAASAIAALGSGAKAAQNALRRALSDSEPLVRKRVAKALESLD